MRTYRELFRTPEFTPLFLAGTLQVAGQTVSGLALGTLVYSTTSSPLLSSLAMFGPSLAHMLGAALLLSAADRLPPRSALTLLLAVFSAGTAAQALPGLPVWGVFALLPLLGVLASVAGGVRYGLLNEILRRDGYLLGRSVLNMSSGIVQLCGYALGGALVVLLSPRGTLLAGAGLYLAGAVVACCGLGTRPPRVAGRPSVRETWRDNALLWSSRRRRHVYLALWLPNGLVVGCESLFVAYAPDRAGLLFACGAVGMLAGDTAVGRFVPPRHRDRLPVPLLVLLAVPFLLFPLRPALPVACALVLCATVGFAASLPLQGQLMALTPERLSGHALGLHSAGMLAWQGIGSAAAGALAEHTAPPTGMAVCAGASLLVTLTLRSRLRPDTARDSPGPTTAHRPRPDAPAPTPDER